MGRGEQQRLLWEGSSSLGVREYVSQSDCSQTGGGGLRCLLRYYCVSEKRMNFSYGGRRPWRRRGKGERRVEEGGGKKIATASFFFFSLSIPSSSVDSPALVCQQLWSGKVLNCGF